MNKQGRSFMTNGVLLAAATVLLAVYITLDSSWSIGTVIVITLTALMSAFQFWLYFHFFGKKG
jgi:hypothetical protein